MWDSLLNIIGFIFGILVGYYCGDAVVVSFKDFIEYYFTKDNDEED